METPAAAVDRIEREAIHASAEGRLSAAEQLWQLAMSTVVTTGVRPRQDLARFADARGVALLHLGRLDDAVAQLTEGFSMAVDESDLVPLTHHLAAALAELGEYDEAVTLNQANLRRLTRLETVAGLSAADAQASLATILGETGEVEGSATLLTELLRQSDSSDFTRRCSIASNLAMVHGMRDDPVAASAAFAACIQSAVAGADARLADKPFLDGLYVGLEVMIEPDGELWATRVNAVRMGRAGDQAAALAAFAEVGERAAELGDVLTSLQCQVNMVVAHDQLGTMPAHELQQIAAELRATALEWDLAPAAALADLALLSFRSAGVEANDTGLSLVELAVEALLLARLTAQHAAELAATARGRIPELDQGVALAFLGARALDCRAYPQAIELLHESLVWAERLGDERAQVIRLAGLLEAMAGGGSAGAPTEVVERLRQVVAKRGDDDRLRLPGLLALGAWCGAGAEQSLADLWAAQQCYERLRARAPTDLTVQAMGSRLESALLEAALEAGSSVEAFQALQFGRARDLVDLLAASVNKAVAPPDAATAVRLIGELPGPNALVDIVTTESGLCAFVVDAQGVQRLPVRGETRPLRGVQFGDARRRAHEVVALTAADPLLHELVSRVESVVDADAAVLLCVDEVLSNLPWHAIEYQGRPWCASRPIGRIPAVGVLGLRDRGTVLGGGAVVVGDSRGDLPGAAAECDSIARQLNTTPLLGARCTIDAVRAVLGRHRHDIVHLALHGRADVRHGGRASLLFADGSGGQVWAPFEALLGEPWHTSLLTLSGCSTAVGGPQDGRGLSGIAHAAAAAGAATVVASLWPVDDASTQVFMAHFYERLAQARRVSAEIDLRPIVDHARTVLRQWLDAHDAPSVPQSRDGGPATRPVTAANDGPSLEDSWPTQQWAAFVLIGDPILHLVGTG